MRVLIVDDEEMIRDSLADYLEDDGFQVWTASSGEEGLRVLSRERMECCVVDMRLPGMNGDEFVVKSQPDANRAQVCDPYRIERIQVVQAASWVGHTTGRLVLQTRFRSKIHRGSPTQPQTAISLSLN
jgi:CheY-like chemotaxis protein